MIMYTNTSMVHMGIITHHSPLYEGNDQVAMAIQTFIIPLHSFNTSNGPRGDCEFDLLFLPRVAHSTMACIVVWLLDVFEIRIFATG